MPETVAYIADMVDGAGTLDVTDIFEHSWAISQEVRAKLDKRFPDLVRDPSTDDLQNYGVDPSEGPGGNLSAYVGEGVDWMVHSWIGEFKKAFCNVHITVWLGPHIDVPHLGMAFGTSPRPWFYLDHMVRRDCNTSIDYFDKYVAYRNERYLEIKTDPRLTTFTSRDPYIRQVLTPTAMCFSADNNDEMWALMRELTHEMVDQWLTWVDEAEPTPLEDRADLAARDQILRRTIVQRDPANVLAVRRYPEGIEEKLVRALAGDDRVLPRPSID
jgi:Red chlorophyll catabolite reductase (RCC reductase)